MLKLALKGLWRALIGPVGIVLALAAAVAWLWKLWRASRDPNTVLPRLQAELDGVNQRLADLGDSAKGEAAALRIRKTALEEQLQATERLKVSTSDLGKSLEALAARDMAGWTGAAEAAREKAQDLAGDLPDATKQVDELAEAVRVFGREGKLTPAVLREIAQQGRNLGVPLEDLPPEIANIIRHFDRLDQADPEDLLGDIGAVADETAGQVEGLAGKFAELVREEVESIKKARQAGRVRQEAWRQINEGWLSELQPIQVVVPQIDLTAAAKSATRPAILAQRLDIGPITLPTAIAGPAVAQIRAGQARVQEIGQRWGETFARAFEGGGGIGGAARSILTTDLGGMRRPTVSESSPSSCGAPSGALTRRKRRSGGARRAHRIRPLSSVSTRSAIRRTSSTACET